MKSHITPTNCEFTGAYVSIRSFTQRACPEGHFPCCHSPTSLRPRRGPPGRSCSCIPVAVPTPSCRATAAEPRQALGTPNRDAVRSARALQGWPRTRTWVRAGGRVRRAVRTQWASTAATKREAQRWTRLPDLPVTGACGRGCAGSARRWLKGRALPAAARFYWLASGRRGPCLQPRAAHRLLDLRAPSTAARADLAARGTMSRSLDAARSFLHQLEARGGREGAVLASEFRVSGRVWTAARPS